MLDAGQASRPSRPKTYFRNLVFQDAFLKHGLVNQPMKLFIDNLDGSGSKDYAGFVDTNNSLRVVRKLNQPAELKVGLVSSAASFVVPVSGARVILSRDDGTDLFSGYVTTGPAYEYLGWNDRGQQYRYELCALSDVMLLDQKAPPPHPPFVARSAGDAFRQLTLDALPAWFDLTAIEAGDPIPYFSVDPAKLWTASAAEIAVSSRCSYRDDNGKLMFSPLAEKTHGLAESDAAFSPEKLQLQRVSRLANDLTITGQLEPSAHVKDYFVGDGYTSTFYLSQIPFTRSDQTSLYNRTILNEEYQTLDPTHWVVADPAHALSVSGGQLQVAGGTGADGQTCLAFVEKIELGGATVMDHGDVVFSGASDGVIGGLYSGATSIAGCVAGFRITRAGANCNIQALVEGGLTGTSLSTQPGHHYVFTTQLYPGETYRMQQVFHSSTRASGNERGGNAVGCDVRIVLEVQDIDVSNPASQIAAATVLYDGVISNAPGFCNYVLINAATMQCSVSFTYLFLTVDALVRSTLPGQNPRTRRTGSLLEGAECRVSNSPTLQFYPEYIPAAQEAIEVTYRGRGHAMARVINAASIAALKNGADDGVRGSVRHVATPVPRTSADCEVAALALLDDAGYGWAGQYQAWSQFLPGNSRDVFPGDGLAVDIQSRAAKFLAIVSEVEVEAVDLGGEIFRYTLRFTDAGDPSLDFRFETAAVRLSSVLTALDVSAVGNTYLPDLTGAEITAITSTAVTIDAGTAPAAGNGIEVRYSDAGWGADNNRNLVGRFTTETFSLPRYGRAQNYFLRSYDRSSPAKYSRYSTALHVDSPL